MIATPGPLVSPEWLAEHLGEDGLMVADSRWTPDGSGRAEFASAHISGAVYLDTDDDLAAPPSRPGGRHPLPEPVVFAATMSRAGIRDDDAVVVYDVSQGSHAVRLWWMLTVTGHDAAVLDGGLQAWDGPIERGEAAPRSPCVFTPTPWPPDAIADADSIAGEVRTGQTLLLDARAPERYRGEVEPYDAKAGHIPGAINAPWSENLDPETGRFRSPAELAERYGDLGGDRTTIVQCGSGITAVHDALAMRIAGLPMPRLYVGSWSDWISDPKRPIATGDRP
ncbi:MAG: thiosulfate/3-mercaptopyruvate sulfurtransferase [Actinomycetota bacterium]|jgi:thiosulfate/3-mercaptopyruvate sulfurtransferase|nr:thiosulfate/3-mercaptopyruvate sulfurtransferase [Actinomycetota bacterium]